MDIANSEFLQVWQQVQQWPTEMRQDLAEQIIRSVESDAPNSSGEWNEAKNSRRVELIDQEIQGSLGVAERRELELLTCEFRAFRQRVAPIPIAGAQRLHQELLRKRQAGRG